MRRDVDGFKAGGCENRAHPLLVRESEQAGRVRLDVSGNWRQICGGRLHRQSVVRIFLQRAPTSAAAPPNRLKPAATVENVGDGSGAHPLPQPENARYTITLRTPTHPGPPPKH